MTLRTLLRYLFLLDRQAIREIAGCRSAIWVGLLFVLSAGFAREYDGEDLLHEPWHLALPLGASLATSFLLFALVWWVSRRGQWNEVSFVRAYRSFLSVYWMTAPLAWIYAIPVERFLSPADAVSANLWLLAIVAAWRVVLMFHVVSTLFRLSVGQAFFPVMLFADAVALAILYFTPLPVFSLMGGIRLNESEQLIQSIAFGVGAVGILSAPGLLISTLVIAYRIKPESQPRQPDEPQLPVSRPLCIVSVFSLLVWCVVLPLTQPEQRLRWQVENLFHTGQLAEAIKCMSAQQRSDFPPHWDPPPRIGYGQTTPPIAKVLELVLAADVKPWVANLYLEKYEAYLDRGYHTYFTFWKEMNSDEFDRQLTILESLPPDSTILAEQRENLENMLKSDPERSEEQLDRLRTLLESFPADETR